MHLDHDPNCLQTSLKLMPQDDISHANFPTATTHTHDWDHVRMVVGVKDDYISLNCLSKSKQMTGDLA